VEGRVERDEQVHWRARDAPAASDAERAAHGVLYPVDGAQGAPKRRAER